MMVLSFCYDTWPQNKVGLFYSTQAYKVAFFYYKLPITTYLRVIIVVLVCGSKKALTH